MTTSTLKLTQLLDADAAFHFSRVVLTRTRPSHLHNHDFFELFWIQHGRARHHISGAVLKLSEGDLLFIRPDDRHALQGIGDETHLVNVIFPRKMIDQLGKRHGFQDRFFWSTADLPTQVFRNSRQLADLSHRALKLESGPRTLLLADAFLSTLLAELTAEIPALPLGIPAWLTAACTAAHSPQVFRDGASGLVRVSGRSHAHVSRAMQRFLGQTPTDYMNQIRISHASRALIGCSDTLEEIATDCGLTNLSHFHHLFRDHLGMTPHQYRKKYQKNPVQPV